MIFSRLAERLRAVARAADVRPHKPKPDPMKDVDAALRAQVNAERTTGSDIAPPVMSEKVAQVSDLPPITHPAPKVMTTSKAGLDLIKSFESCAKAIGGGRFQAYPDPAPGRNGLPVTIGWGSTRGFDGKPIPLGTVWTQDQCDRKKAEDMADFEREVRAILGHAPTTQGQFDALVSFAYNLGSAALRGSTLMRRHKAGDYEGAAAQFARWNKAGGRVMRGLTRRREAEAALYRSGS